MKTLAFVAGLLTLCFIGNHAASAASPRALRGEIITSVDEILMPRSAEGFVRKLLDQDQTRLERGRDGTWLIHFVAFFDRPLPVNHLGVVVLDSRGEPVSLAQVDVRKGQWNLASFIEVESSATNEQSHTLQLFYARAGKPVVLATKSIILR